MKNYFLFSLILFILLSVSSCKEHHEKEMLYTGHIINLYSKGKLWDTWEVVISANEWNDMHFSIDRDNNRNTIYIDSARIAMHQQKKVIVTYYESANNWFSNRGETDRFITGIRYLN